MIIFLVMVMALLRNGQATNIWISQQGFESNSSNDLPACSPCFNCVNSICANSIYASLLQILLGTDLVQIRATQAVIFVLHLFVWLQLVILSTLVSLKS